MKDLDAYLDEAIKNIREDRAITATLLTDLVVYLKASEERHREVGPVAAKYVETLQRSNEQLVKVASLIQKKRASSANLTEEDKNEIFDILNEGSEQ
tara:strand:- start:46 stop:336 length:291 start_codon:yes stop_codon:yes gene_type:complete